MFDINKAVKEWRAVRSHRLNLQDLAKKLSDGPEAKLRGEILMYLDTQGIKGAKTEHGTISRKQTSHMEIMNIEQLCKYMYDNMTQAIMEGKPLADSLIFQKTPSKGIITEIVRDNLDIYADEELSEEEFNKEADKLGVRIVSKSDISFTSK